MMYSVSDLKCLWQIQSGLFPLRDPSTTTKQLSHDVSHDKHKTGDLYYMGEINSNGTSVIVEERDDACTMIHLCSSNGELVRSLRLESLDGKREVHTHMISSGNNGYYVIMAQGGYALVIKGEELEVSKTIHVVRYVCNYMFVYFSSLLPFPTSLFSIPSPPLPLSLPFSFTTPSLSLSLLDALSLPSLLITLFYPPSRVTHLVLVFGTTISLFYHLIRVNLFGSTSKQVQPVYFY